MKIFILFLFIATLITPSFASEKIYQILITKTSKKQNLSKINTKLKAYNVKMYMQKSQKYYLIYSNKYSNITLAKKSLQDIKKEFPSAFIVSKSINKEDKKTKTTTKIKIKSNPKNNDFFIALGAGVHNTKIDTTSNQESDKDTSYTIEAGYYLNENIFASLAYLSTPLEGVDIQNIYTSLNYQFNMSKNFGLYTGVLAGYSTLELTGYDSSTASNSMLIGGQIGLVYTLFEHLSLYSSYQGISFEHIIDIKDDDSKITFDFIHNVQAGVQLRF